MPSRDQEAFAVQRAAESLTSALGWRRDRAAGSREVGGAGAQVGRSPAHDESKEAW